MEEPFVWGLKIPGYVWLLWRILWELGFVRRCVRVFVFRVSPPERLR